MKIFILILFFEGNVWTIQVAYFELYIGVKIFNIIKKQINK